MEQANVESEDDAENQPSDDDSDAPYEGPSEKKAKFTDPYPGVEMKKKIVDYWVMSEHERRPFRSVKSRFKKVASVRQLRRWRNRLLAAGTIKPNIDCAPKHNLIHNIFTSRLICRRQPAG